VSEFHDGALADAAPGARLPARARWLQLRARWTQARVAFGRYELVFAAVIGIALAARVVDLTAKPFHHDESEHAWFAWRLVSGHGYEYNPVFHGPVQFYVISLLYWLIGAGDVAARLAPALVGTALIGLPYLLRRQVGSVAAFAAAALFCISPSYLYFSRFVREDIYAACATLALIVAIFRFIDRPRPWHPSVVLGLLAVSFAVKESTYITVAIFAPFFVLALLWQARRAGSLRRAPLAMTIASVGRDPWIWGVATFAAVYTLLFTTFLTNPHGLQDGVIESIRYWLSQQPVNRGGQPPYYYLVVIPAYEWPVLLLGAAGVATVVRRPTLLGVFLISDFVLSLVLYSAAGERMPGSSSTRCCRSSCSRASACRPSGRTERQSYRAWGSSLPRLPRGGRSGRRLPSPMTILPIRGSCSSLRRRRSTCPLCATGSSRSTATCSRSEGDTCGSRSTGGRAPGGPGPGICGTCRSRTRT